jgi:peptidyl-tRNA hydrolase
MVPRTFSCKRHVPEVARARVAALATQLGMLKAKIDTAKSSAAQSATFTLESSRRKHFVRRWRREGLEQ